MKLSRFWKFLALLSVFSSEVNASDASRVVRIAQLEIDPLQLDAYKAALKEEMEMSVKTEPGVLSIYSVAERDHPNRLHFFEVYADQESYDKHIASPHFQKYFVTTQSMILSKKLIETDVVQLSAQKK